MKSSGKPRRPSKKTLVEPAPPEQLPYYRAHHLGVFLHSAFQKHGDIPRIDARAREAITAEISEAGGLFRWAAAQPDFQDRLRRKLRQLTVGAALQDLLGWPASQFRDFEAMTSFAREGGATWVNAETTRVQGEIEVMLDAKALYESKRRAPSFAERQEAKRRVAEINLDIADQRSLLGELQRLGKIVELFEAGAARIATPALEDS